MYVSYAWNIQYLQKELSTGLYLIFQVFSHAVMPPFGLPIWKPGPNKRKYKNVLLFCMGLTKKVTGQSNFISSGQAINKKKGKEVNPK